MPQACPAMFSNYRATALAAAVALATAVPAVASTVLVAGDIANCTRTSDTATATLLEGMPGIVLTAGDNAYPQGSPVDFRDCYAPTWGRVLGRTRPAPGNHDWQTPHRAGYFGYFGGRAGPVGRGYYAFNLGVWRIYSLDSTRCYRPDPGAASGCARGSAQYAWLKADLMANPHVCVMAVWHHPRFSSGLHGSSLAPKPLFALLYRRGAEVVVNGHDHLYERLARVQPNGRRDSDGIRQFIVGTGGAPLYPFRAIAPHSRFRDNRHHGVLRLRLWASGYSWGFLAAPGGALVDSGVGTCHA